MLAGKDLLKSFSEAYFGRRGGSFGLFSRRQMTQQSDAGRRGGEQHALLLVTDDINSLALSQGLDLEHIQFGAATLLDGEPLPVSKEPDATEKNSDDQNQARQKRERRKRQRPAMHREARKLALVEFSDWAKVLASAKNTNESRQIVRLQKLRNFKF